MRLFALGVFVVGAALVVGSAWGEEDPRPTSVMAHELFADAPFVTDAGGARGASRGWWILRLRLPPTREDRESLASAETLGGTASKPGLSLTRYIGDGQYLEYLDGDQIAAFGDWSGGNGPLYASHLRLDTDLREESLGKALQTLGVSRETVLRVRTLTDESTDGVGRLEETSVAALRSDDLVIGLEIPVRRESEDVDASALSRPRREKDRVECPDTAEGLQGNDQVVNIIDSWLFDGGHAWFKDRKVDRTDDAETLPDMPHSHATFVAGIVVKEGAPGGDVEKSRVRLHETRLTNDANLTQALERAAWARPGGPAPAHIHVAPWHFNRPYDSTSADVDLFVWNNEEDLFIASAGAEHLGSPASSRNALTVAAARCWPDDRPSHGKGYLPSCVTERRKPDIHAPGCGTRSAKGIADAEDDGWDLFGSYCATSWAAPEAAVMAAQASTFYQTMYGNPPAPIRPSAALIKATLIDFANPVAAKSGDKRARNSAAGNTWGLPSLDDLESVNARGKLIVKDVRRSNGLGTGEHDDHFVEVSDPAIACLTLAWTDAPTQGAALSNDLDLSVLDAAGQVLPVVGDPDETCSSLGEDSLNNVERLRVELKPGRNVFRVLSRATYAQQSLLDGQGYALVVSASAPMKDHGVERWSAHGVKKQKPKLVTPIGESVDKKPVKPPSWSKAPGARFDHYWAELEVDGGMGVLDGGETGGIWAADGEFRYLRFRQPAQREATDGMGLGGTEIIRKDEFAFGVAKRDQELSDGPTFMQDGEFAWAYYDRSLRRPSPDTKRAWGLLADVANLEREEGDDATVVHVTPGMSFSFDSPGDCERNRLAIHAALADGEDGDDFAVGATFSVLRGEDGDDFDARCAQASVFRRMYLDDHRNYHVAYEHREHQGDDDGVDGSLDYLAFEGQVPLKHREPAQRHVTFDWYAAIASIRTDATSITDNRQDWLSQADVGLYVPLGKLVAVDGFTRREFGMRLGLSGRWLESDAPLLDRTDFVATLTFHAVLGGGGSTDKRAIRWPDVPGGGSTGNPGTGSGPGDFNWPTPP